MITSISGEIVYRNNLILNNNDTYLFNNLDLTSGIYFIKLINNKGDIFTIKDLRLLNNPFLLILIYVNIFNSHTYIPFLSNWSI